MSCLPDLCRQARPNQQKNLAGRELLCAVDNEWHMVRAGGSRRSKASCALQPAVDTTDVWLCCKGLV